MRRLIVLTFMSLDGVIQAPGGPDEDPSGGFSYGGWIVPHSDEFIGKVMGEQMSRSFSLLLGRKTYDIFAGYWPQHEDAWPGVNAAAKYVASHNASLRLNWNNSELLKGNAAEAVQRLKSQDGPELHVYGSADFCQTLFRQDLVDKLWLKIYPVTLGAGKRLFGSGTIPAAFRLGSSSVSPKGVIVASYQRAGAVETGSF